MTQLIKPGEWKRYWIAAILLGVLFLAIEVYPMVKTITEHEYNHQVISKDAASEAAEAFVKEMTGEAVKVDRVVHQTNKLLNGYLTKEKLLESYEKQYGNAFPGDTFQVNLSVKGAQNSSFVYVHMYTGEITGWKVDAGGEALTGAEQSRTLAAFLASRGLDAAAFNETSPGLLESEVTAIGEAPLTIVAHAKFVNGQSAVVEYKPAFQPPKSYIDYVGGQDKLAGWLTGVGYVLMSIVLGILAIIYSILYRKHTSFKYGIILTSVFLITYLIMNLNILDGIVASEGESTLLSGMLPITIIFTIFLAVVMAGSIYVSIVAGDGLWKAQGRNLWPRPSAPGYGDYIWRSMGLSYLFAIAMLGLQPLLFKGLELVIGTWSTTDVVMSPYNISILWLMPVLAWAAAISEEAVFRLFGIGLMRKWFRVTWAAAILPTLFWSLGHVTYPFYPATTRLIELMIIGLLFSFIFVKYGFATAMFTHAIFNSIAVASSLYAVGSAADIASATFFIVLPVIIAWVLREWNKRAQRKGPPVMATAADPQAPR